MNRKIERRQSERGSDDGLSPEFLRVLEVCGGAIRESDRIAIAERRKAELPNGQTGASEQPALAPGRAGARRDPSHRS